MRVSVSIQVKRAREGHSYCGSSRWQIVSLGFCVNQVSQCRELHQSHNSRCYKLRIWHTCTRKFAQTAVTDTTYHVLVNARYLSF